MQKGWILFLALLCVAFLVSCGKHETRDMENSELIKSERYVGGYYGRNEDG